MLPRGAGNRAAFLSNWPNKLDMMDSCAIVRLYLSVRSGRLAGYGAARMEGGAMASLSVTHSQFKQRRPGAHQLRVKGYGSHVPEK